ncbi:MAG: 8-amino-7-oxononanoate synthase [Nitrospinota bacterium]|nr:8-amino-7-oxononanoate synthase [Nitrospinota bacterium]
MNDTNHKADKKEWSDFISKTVSSLKENQLLRSLRTVNGCQSPIMKFNGKKIIMMSSNNYLGLADHPEVIRAASLAATKYGSSSSASPLLSGFMEIHESLCKLISSWKEKEKTILFGSGFLANIGIITSLVGKGDVIFSDELNHASIIEGCRLSAAQVKIFPHNNLSILSKLLKQTSKKKKRLIVVDGVFSMDGDLAPLDEITSLAQKYNALLIVDEAHATGILGTKGRGAASLFKVEDEVDISMGTLGKSLASYGAFVSSESDVIDYLTNKARTFIYSTSIPPSAVASALKSVRLVQGKEGGKRRKKLLNLCHYLSSGLEKIGFSVNEEQSCRDVPIFPLIIGDTEKTSQLSNFLMKAGIFSLAIRPPTVPEGTSRIRISLMATHKKEHIDSLLDALEIGSKKLKISLCKN